MPGGGYVVIPPEITGLRAQPWILSAELFQRLPLYVEIAEEVLSAPAQAVPNAAVYGGHQIGMAQLHAEPQAEGHRRTAAVAIDPLRHRHR
jgi:hypothetical protein